jgi:hypothetical protein
VTADLAAQGAVRAPLDEALARESRALDLRVARTWQVLTFIGIVGGFLVDWALGFAEGTALAVLNHDVPPLAGLPADRSEAWESFFRRALAADKGARFQSAAEMSEALGHLRRTTHPRHETFARLVAEASEEREPDTVEPATEATRVDAPQGSGA